MNTQTRDRVCLSGSSPKLRIWFRWSLVCLH